MVFPCRSVMGAVSQMCIYKFRTAYLDSGKLSVISQLTLINTDNTGYKRPWQQGLVLLLSKTRH